MVVCSWWQNTEEKEEEKEVELGNGESPKLGRYEAKKERHCSKWNELEVDQWMVNKN